MTAIEKNALEDARNNAENPAALALRYVTMDEDARGMDIFETSHATAADAIEQARSDWNHLTSAEQRHRRITVYSRVCAQDGSSWECCYTTANGDIISDGLECYWDSDTQNQGGITMDNYITAESFGSDIPENWQEIADELNRIIDERGIADDHDAVNELWEEYWSEH